MLSRGAACPNLRRCGCNRVQIAERTLDGIVVQYAVGGQAIHRAHAEDDGKAQMAAQPGAGTPMPRGYHLTRGYRSVRHVSGSARGRQKLNVLPSPGYDASRNSDPCRSSISLQIASPRPVPGGFWVKTLPT